ncbi:DUF3052 family protein [Motilibacter rhizosphaerae]|uniref:DUF3052 family protein n=1 Tax=Motilibacter rhizosphaerae TaxID=598652 RepID=A0A4Q7NB35_9ACTN|nr:DUF3052 family protein [Motilibacter rhizosphaerae]RZS80181.1 DUF3052 family protein [Motilibacter rhizosphaerae]
MDVGYSGTPLARKLGIRAGSRVLLAGAPAGFVVPDLPDGTVVHRRAGSGDYDVVLAFVVQQVELARALERLPARLSTAGGLWLCWPKRSSGVVTGLGEGDVRAAGLASGLVDNKVCAVDATWSGLRFVRRLADR